MKMLNSHKSEVIGQTIQEQFGEKCIVFSDKSTSYVNILDYVENSYHSEVD
jgi:hypothetical protein